MSSPENKEELNPPKPKKPALERRTITSPVKVCYPLEKLFEYQWPPDIHGEFYYLEYQVSDFVADIALPQKHPGKKNKTNALFCQFSNHGNNPPRSPGLKISEHLIIYASNLSQKIHLNHLPYTVHV